MYLFVALNTDETTMGEFKITLKTFLAKNSNKGTKHFQIYAVNNQGLQGNTAIVTSPLLALGRLISTLPHFSGLPQFNSALHFSRLVLLTSAPPHFCILGIRFLMIPVLRTWRYHGVL